MNKLNYALILLIVPVVLSVSKVHEYYVSVTSVEYAKDQQTIQIISQIFIDDFEQALRMRYDENLLLAGENEMESVNSLMERYLKAKLKLWVNGEEVQFQFLGKEYKEDIVYCYLEIADVSYIDSITMSNKILLDIFDTQQNIARFKISDKNKSFLMVRENAECMLNFD
ncbi:peptidase E [Winogradskyella sp. DF17]|jgi:hypothetical protein|uniref:Peptidase E n=1 Tax=Winogradskyella pelagia TaxID=2819984 RepID=A0ABS3T0R0_9FLAO|nr:DUF6702 family protein [Winogradskyella sp. DF17]MBO3115839.1 peptidase E [Winogradskyella sp. DF17]